MQFLNTAALLEPVLAIDHDVLICLEAFIDQRLSLTNLRDGDGT